MKLGTTITKFEKSQVANVQQALDSVSSIGLSVRYEDVIPTVDTLQENEIVVYDDGAGDKRIFTITRKGNLGYVVLT